MISWIDVAPADDVDAGAGSAPRSHAARPAAQKRIVTIRRRIATSVHQRRTGGTVAGLLVGHFAIPRPQSMRLTGGRDVKRPGWNGHEVRIGWLVAKGDIKGAGENGRIAGVRVRMRRDACA